MITLLQLASQIADLTADTKRKSFVGAVAVRRDGVLVSSRNQGVENSSHRNPLLHAEARVLRKSGFGATVYVARIRRDGSLAMSKPCSRCMAALRARGVEVVYYTISNTEWDACKP